MWGWQRQTQPWFVTVNTLTRDTRRLVWAKTIQFYVHVIIDGCSCGGIKPVRIASFPLSSVGKLGVGLKINFHLVYVHMCMGLLCHSALCQFYMLLGIWRSCGSGFILSVFSWEHLTVGSVSSVSRVLLQWCWASSSLWTWLQGVHNTSERCITYQREVCHSAATHMFPVILFVIH